MVRKKGRRENWREGERERDGKGRKKEIIIWYNVRI